MVEQLTKGATLVCPPSLCTIYCIEGLVKEQADREGQVYPRGHVCIEGRVIPEHGEEVQDDEAETSQGDLSRQFMKVR